MESRRKLRTVARAAVLLALFVACCPLGFADSCAAAPLSSIIGLQCEIGNLSFDFSGTRSGDSGFDGYSYDSSLDQPYGRGLSASNIQFVPITVGTGSGFTLTSDIAVNSALGGTAFSSFYFFYGVRSIDGTPIGSIHLFGDPVAAGTNACASLDAFGAADANYEHWRSSNLTAATWAPQSSSLRSGSPMSDLSWWGYSSFYVEAIDDSSASFPHGTVLYETVPEPGILALVGAGLLCLGVRIFSAKPLTR